MGRKLRRRVKRLEDRVAVLEAAPEWAPTPPTQIEMDPRPPLRDGPLFDPLPFALDDEDGWRGIYL